MTMNQPKKIKINKKYDNNEVIYNFVAVCCDHLNDVDRFRTTRATFFYLLSSFIRIYITRPRRKLLHNIHCTHIHTQLCSHTHSIYRREEKQWSSVTIIVCEAQTILVHMSQRTNNVIHIHSHTHAHPSILRTRRKQIPSWPLFFSHFSWICFFVSPPASISVIIFTCIGYMCVTIVHTCSWFPICILHNKVYVYFIKNSY